jgi:TolB-like protein
MAAMLATAADPSDKLAKVKTIFVAPLEGPNNDYSQMLHEKVISGLMKVPGISVVDDETNADAILTVTSFLESHPTEYGHTRYLMQGGVRLTAKDGGLVLWADNITSSHFARSASSSFADNLAKSLNRAISGEKR